MLGSIISAGSSLLGGLFGKSAQEKANKQALKFQKNFIQYRVEDAKKAGIHPLAALGASANYSPVSTAGFGDSIAQAGAAIGDGLNRSQDKKASAGMQKLNEMLITSNIDTNKAQADLYRAQALNATQEARNKAIGAVGGKNTLPNFMGKEIPYAKNTSSAQDMEDQIGGLADILAGIAVLEGIDINKPNPFLYLKRKKPLELTVRRKDAKGGHW